MAGLPRHFAFAGRSSALAPLASPPAPVGTGLHILHSSSESLDRNRCAAGLRQRRGPAASPPTPVSQKGIRQIDPLICRNQRGFSGCPLPETRSAPSL